MMLNINVRVCCSLSSWDYLDVRWGWGVSGVCVCEGEGEKGLHTWNDLAQGGGGQEWHKIHLMISSY